MLKFKLGCYTSLDTTSTPFPTKSRGVQGYPFLPGAQLLSQMLLASIHINCSPNSNSK